MGKIGCYCGHTILDSSDNLKYKGDIVPDIVHAEIFDHLSNLIDELELALQTGKKREWINKNFQVPPYPLDLSGGNMIHDLFFKFYLDKTKNIFQCEKCGRILIQKGQSERFVFFKPEEDDWRNILAE